MSALAAAWPAAAVTRPAEIAVIAGAKCSADGTCADAVITPARYEHWLRIARAYERPGAPEIASGMRASVMRLLIDGWWVRGEAARQGIVVTRKRVRRDFRQQTASAFRNRRQYRRFLRRSRQTTRDILYRIRTDLLSAAIRRRVTAPAGDDPEEQQRLLDEFAVDYRERWRAATRCASRYRIDSCGA